MATPSERSQAEVVAFLSSALQPTPVESPHDKVMRILKQLAADGVAKERVLAYPWRGDEKDIATFFVDDYPVKFLPREDGGVE